MQIRVDWMRWLSFLISFVFFAALPASAAEAVRIGLTPAFLNERHGLMADWQKYLERKMGRPVTFVLRDSYQSTMELLHQRRIDVAWLCDCPHVTANPDFRLLVTPLFQGRPFYRSYLVVPEADRATRSIHDLKGKVFAYTDPFSNIGYLFPRYEIMLSGEEPEFFFRRTFFTRSQRKSIEAVVAGVADGTTVNSYVWETIHQQAPALTGRTRVASKSREYGFPPFVAEKNFSAKAFLSLQKALIDMSADAQGKQVLIKMNIDGFTLPQAERYEDVKDIFRYMRGE